MDENIIAANLAAKIETNTHVPAPVVEEGPQPSAFETNIELNDPAIGLQLTDYFDIGRIDRFNEVTQRQLRSVYQWAAERAGSAELANVLGVIRSVELELGATYAPDRLVRIAKFVQLNKQSEAIRIQQDSLYA
jgi:hypothetical protein